MAIFTLAQDDMLNLLDYAEHRIWCSQHPGTEMRCTCGHLLDIHLMSSSQCACSGCKCKKFTEIECTCGLGEMIKKVRESCQ